MLTLHERASALGPRAALSVCHLSDLTYLSPGTAELPLCLSQAHHVLQPGVGSVLGTAFSRRAGKGLRVAMMKVESALPWCGGMSTALWASQESLLEVAQPLQWEHLRHLAKTSQT